MLRDGGVYGNTRAVGLSNLALCGQDRRLSLPRCGQALQTLRCAGAGGGRVEAALQAGASTGGLFVGASRGSGHGARVTGCRVTSRGSRAHSRPCSSDALGRQRRRRSRGGRMRARLVNATATAPRSVWLRQPPPRAWTCSSCARRPFASQQAARDHKPYYITTPIFYVNAGSYAPMAPSLRPIDMPAG